MSFQLRALFAKILSLKAVEMNLFLLEVKTSALNSSMIMEWFLKDSATGAKKVLNASPRTLNCTAIKVNSASSKMGRINVSIVTPE